MKDERNRYLDLLLAIVLPLLTFAQGWYTQTSGTNKSLFDVHFVDTQNGWIASMTNSIFYTSDGGQTWVDLEPQPSVNYWGIYFVTILEGYAVGSPGKIRHTTDAGITWEDQTGGDYNNWGVYFLDENSGWIAGGREEGFPGQDPIRYIYHTSNGGDNWTAQLYDFDELQLWAVHFFDADIGYAVGDGGTIFHTTNGGGAWLEQTSGTIRHLRSVHATSPDTAWAVGVGGLVLRTIDGGSTWDSLYVGVSYGLSDIYFVNYQTGWIAGGDTINGIILSTTNAGDSWVLQNSGTSNFLYAIYFTDPDTGWAVGYDGTIVHTTSGGTGIEELSDFTKPQSEVVLTQNNPNPFSRSTVISFTMPKTSRVELKVYDLIGQEVAILVDEELYAGEHAVIFDGKNLPNGVYFYRLTSGDITKTKLCVLLR
ncbi:hypothetical protein AMJ83_07045 [candidate division WOR_3 bacterium SM23_42]|uniref:Secretion system C-terminal sorting domain-containing protein n=1 Tax=candidate division WOR_3 bacterium SM23_42 TaxID=1703779 RepID=A0A0S8FU73_UNCW3|nr:MAG: hypothetical protein AMJ83_07045 [candidate division WOR_3 bacterium SM23_42]